MSETLVHLDRGPEGVAGSPDREGRSATDFIPAVPATLVLVALLATLWPDGSFAIRRWALVAILVFGVLAVGTAAGSSDRRPRLLAAGLLWTFAAWAALSMLWATSAQLAWESAGRAALYAGIVAVPVLALPRHRDVYRLTGMVLAGLGLVVAIALIATLIRGGEAFLAGRLNEPLDYRNGAACLMAMAFWPLVSAAAGSTLWPWWRALGGALAGGALGLAVLTQSRGTLIALVLGGIVALAVGPERRRRLWIALALAAGVAVLWHPLQAPYHGFVVGHADLGPDLRTAAGAVAGLVALGAVAGLVSWALDSFTSERLEPAARRLSDVAVAVLVVVAVVGALVATGNPIDTARDKVHEFKTLEPAAPTASRLGTVGGQRYDLWRIALKEWEAHPLHGVGAGNYLFDYFRERRTDRNLSDAHSLPLGLLAETGLVGALLFLGALGVLIGKVAVGARRAPPKARRWAGALAAAGVAVLGQSLVDWMPLLPSLFGLGLLSLALAGRLLEGEEPEPDPEPESGRRSRLPVVARIAAVAPAIVAIVAVGLLYVADSHLRAAADAATPAKRLSAARDASRLDPFSVAAHYQAAGAEEDLGHRAAARSELLDALRLEPDNFATLGLLGDFEVRGGDLAAAHRWYERALAADPRDVGLQKLARRTAR